MRNKSSYIPMYMLRNKEFRIDWLKFKIKSHVKPNTWDNFKCKLCNEYCFSFSVIRKISKYETSVYMKRDYLSDNLRITFEERRLSLYMCNKCHTFYLYVSSLGWFKLQVMNKDDVDVYLVAKTL